MAIGTEAFKRACEMAGGVTKLAERMTERSGDAYGQSRLSNWKQTGVPPECVILVAECIEFGVTPHELREDIYRHPTDGLPPEMRTQEAAA